MMRHILLNFYICINHITRIGINRIRGVFYSGHKNVKIGRGVAINGKVEIKEGVTINDYARINGDPIVHLGKNVYINSFTMILGEVIIEDDVLISQFANIWGRSHKFYARDQPIWQQYGEGGQGYKVGKILIKKGAWIGPHTTIMRGLTIGTGAVIGAGAVVTRDIPDYAVAFGIPAQVRYYRGDANLLRRQGI